MSTEINIERFGRNAVVTGEGVAFSYQVEDSAPDFVRSRYDERYGYDNPVNAGIVLSPQLVYGDYEVIPYGPQNNMPGLLRDIVYNNPNAPGIFAKKQGLLWGKGPALYKEVFLPDSKNRVQRIREWQNHAEIESWLDSWDFQDYLMQCITDFNFIQGSFTKFIKAKSSLLGQNFYHSLEHLNPDLVRLARVPGKIDVSHALVQDRWFPYSVQDYKVYPLLDPAKPFSQNNPVLYARTKTFATDAYAIPTIYGSLEWIRRSTAVPLILRALSKNSMFAKYHIESPQAFWDAKKKSLEAQFGPEYRELMLDDYEKSLFQTISKTLSSIENAGKFLHTKKFIDTNGVNLIEMGWTIKPIDQNIKDFVETQIKIGDKADAVSTNATGMHKALAGISAPGSADSGSEQLYAYLLFKLIEVDIPEMVVCKALNFALRANFPKAGLKVGFYHEEAQRQQDTTSSDRVKNNA